VKPSSLYVWYKTSGKHVPWIECLWYTRQACLGFMRSDVICLTIGKIAVYILLDIRTARVPSAQMIECSASTILEKKVLLCIGRLITKRFTTEPVHARFTWWRWRLGIVIGNLYGVAAIPTFSLSTVLSRGYDSCAQVCKPNMSCSLKAILMC
jgi:hypothetical protein